MEIANAEAQKRYLKEMSVRLAHAGVTVGVVADNSLPVEYGGMYLCRVSGKSGVLYRDRDTEGEKRRAALQRVIDTADTVDEYMRLMERAPHLEATGLHGDYRILADFQNAVLAGHPTKHGVQFITWEWSYDRTGVGTGHYFEQDYIGAKQDFALRAGLIDRDMLFSLEQLTEVYRSIHETLDSAYPITAERSKLLEAAAEQIERAVPDLNQRVDQSNQRELELGMELNGTGQTMY